MRELVLELMGEYGNLAVFLLILVENLFPPIPSEVILTFGRCHDDCTDMTPGGVILFSTAGSWREQSFFTERGDSCRMRYLGNCSVERPDSCSISDRRMSTSRKTGSGIAGSLQSFCADCPDRPEPDLHSRRDCQDAGHSRFLLSRRREAFCGIRFSSMQAESREIPGRRCQLRSGCTQISF